MRLGKLDIFGSSQFSSKSYTDRFAASSETLANKRAAI
jgi:hypothetical protein